MSRPRSSRWTTLSFVLVWIAACHAAGCSGTTCEGDTVTFADARLASAVREAIGKAGQLCAEEASGLRELAAPARGIVDLDGIQALTSLTALDLQDNRVRDLAALSRLTSLTELDLGGNGLHDLVPLEGLASLRVLHLDRNEISDLAPLAGLRALDELDLYRNRITDLAPLVANGDLGAGDRVYVFGNPLDDARRSIDAAALCGRGAQLDPYCPEPGEY